MKIEWNKSIHFKMNAFNSIHIITKETVHQIKNWSNETGLLKRILKICIFFTGFCKYISVGHGLSIIMWDVE